MSRPSDKIRKKMRALAGGNLVMFINAALYECADAVRAEAHRSISAGSVSGKGHKPSAANTPPNRDTGHLQSQIEVSQPESFVSRVTSNAEYSAALEFGTSKMSARPFLRPARDAALPRAKRILAQHLRRAQRAARRQS